MNPPRRKTRHAEEREAISAIYLYGWGRGEAKSSRTRSQKGAYYPYHGQGSPATTARAEKNAYPKIRKEPVAYYV
jgi:hypothetical protein